MVSYDSGVVVFVNINEMVEVPSERFYNGEVGQAGQWREVEVLRLRVQIEVGMRAATCDFCYLFDVCLVVEVAANVKAYPPDTTMLDPCDHFIDEVVVEACPEVLPSCL